MLNEWKNKKIGVLGFGIEGVATTEFLLQQGIVPTVLDKKKESEVEKIHPQVFMHLKEQGGQYLGGKDYLTHLTNFDILVRSPGIRLLRDEIQDAQQKGVIITSHTKLFFDLCPCPIIGVTGTKGKGTTSSLIYHMLEKSGKDAYLGGNIGQPPLTFFDNLRKDSLVVLELSSFQLQDVTKSPHIAVMLMVTSEHLQSWEDQNYHTDIEEYIFAKRNILRYQAREDFAVINRDYLASNESDIYTDGQIYFISRERLVEQGCSIKEGAIVIRRNGQDEVIVDTKDITLPGKHNLENVCAASMAAMLAGASKESIASVLTSFKGLEHRLELVAEINGVKYYDDSFSTTPETAIAAIEVFQQPEILILGGSSKRSDFTELGQLISTKTNIKAIIGMGEEWKEIKKMIHDLPPIVIEEVKSMKQVIIEVSEIAEAGDVVLLSPACASYDMFKDYKDRGEQFKKEVQELKLRSMN